MGEQEKNRQAVRVQIKERMKKSDENLGRLSPLLRSAAAGRKRVPKEKERFNFRGPFLFFLYYFISALLFWPAIKLLFWAKQKIKRQTNNGPK